VPGASSSSKAVESEEPSLGSLDDDFARQLQAGMADLLKGMEDSVNLSLLKRTVVGKYANVDTFMLT